MKVFRPSYAIDGLDLSMRGPLDTDEARIFDAWMADWKDLTQRVPQSVLPEASFGQWRIERYDVTEQESYHLFRKDQRNGGERNVWVAPGAYTRLTTDKPTEWGWPGGELMFDTFQELAFIDHCLDGASGDVLECGLGLGLFIAAALIKPEINSLTVLEIDQSIIENVGKQFQDSRLKIIEADFRTWSPPKNALYDRIWLDTIGEHNTPEAVAKMQSVGDVYLYEPVTG